MIALPIVGVVINAVYKGFTPIERILTARWMSINHLQCCDHGTYDGCLNISTMLFLFCMKKFDDIGNRTLNRFMQG